MKIELFHRQMDPASARARHFLAARGLRARVKSHDLDEETWSRQHLIDLTGVDSVPCLVVDDEPVVDGADVLPWLEKHFPT